MDKKEPKQQLSALSRIYKLIDDIVEDDSKPSKSAFRRQRVALSEMSKLCKAARAELLEKMKT